MTSRIVALTAVLAVGVAIGAISSLSTPIREFAKSLTSTSTGPMAHVVNKVSATAEHHEDNEVHLSAEQIPAARIETVPAGPGVLAKTISVPGTITPDGDKIARVATKVAGTVAALNKRLGDTVDKGEVIAVVDSREVAEAKSEYLGALATFELQKTLFEREQTLWDRKVSAEQQYLRARNTFAEAKLRLDLARQRLAALDVDEAEMATLASASGLSASAAQHPFTSRRSRNRAAR